MVEGVGDLKYDTQWQLGFGGRVDKSFHKKGLSIDGTKEYLDQLEKVYPGHVTVYRKEEGELWEGKVEMVNAPILNIPEDSLLWEVDVDEFWKVCDIVRTRDLFLSNPEKMSAFFYCYYFVGKEKFIVSMNTLSTKSEDWIRAWRFKRGLKWMRHEPPTLVDDSGIDMRKFAFSREETLGHGITFQHFAYVIEEQLKFKEIYYGYKDASNHWNRLQETRGLVELKKYFPWAEKEEALVDDWADEKYGQLLFPGEWML